MHCCCRSLGYFIQENGDVEQQDKFLRRMSGFVRLYAAITVVQPPARRGSSGVRVHPHGVENAWRWLAQTVNVEPRPDITATVLGDFLSVAGHSLHRSYGRQFVKLVRLITDEYMPKIKEVTQPGSGGPVTRLEGLLGDAVAGKLPRAPSGVERTAAPRVYDSYY
jgi:nucleoporin GLE1